MQAKKLLVNLVLLSLIIPAALIAPASLQDQSDKTVVISCMTKIRQQADDHLLEQFFQQAGSQSSVNSSAVELDLNLGKKISHNKHKSTKHNADNTLILGGADAIAM